MKKGILLCFMVVVTTAVYSQTLNEQFKELKESSESFKQYKVIERVGLDEFWLVTMDSVKNLKQQIEAIQTENITKSKNITGLNSTITSKEKRIDELELQTSTIEVFGIDFDKGTFIFISFFTSGALLIALGLILAKFKENNRVAKNKVNDYEKLNDDFEEYKRNALEKQMKLRRDLQTERNKLEEARNV